jgi:hypothetical protein
MTRGGRGLRNGGAAAALLCAAALSLPAFASGALQTTTISTTNTETPFVVPAGIVKVSIQAVGQGGGNNAGVFGGLGGLVSAVKTVSSGDTLYAFVGSNGFLIDNGGGAADVRTVPRSDAGTLASRILVAGGGGSAGSTGTAASGGGGPGTGGQGGDAGAAGTAGVSGGTGSFGGGGGSGATTAAVGAGGTGGATNPAAAPCHDPSNNPVSPADGHGGASGTGTQGGHGFVGAGGFCQGNAGAAVGGDGGGGGDGYFGGGSGGGGGGGDPGDTNASGGGGGGGGSSFIGAALTNPSIGLASRGAAPSVTITYTQPDIAVQVPATGATYGVGSSVAADFSCAAGGAAVSTCVGSVADGAPIDTSSLGPKSFTVIATDANGDQQTSTVNYRVIAAPTLAGTASDALLGSPITDAVTLSGGQAPGGTIDFAVYGPGDASCSSAPAQTTTKPVSGNGSYSQSFTPAAAGTYRWVASYSGDTDNKPKSGACNDPEQTSTVSEPPARDTTAPETTISRRPKFRQFKVTHFGFTADDPGATFECSIDDAPPAECTSPIAYKRLEPGRHVFSVFATDAAGNADATPATDRFRVTKRKGTHH